MEYMHEWFNLLEALLVVVHEITHGLCGVLGRGVLILHLRQFQLLLPFFADTLERASSIHLRLDCWWFTLQLFELGLPLAEVLHYSLKLFLKLLLDFLGLRNWLTSGQRFWDVQFLQSRLLPSKRWFDFGSLVLILEHLNAYTWRSLRLVGAASGLLAILTKVQLLFGPIVQDMHEFFDFVKQLLILIIELN